MRILAINAGSTTLKAALIADGRALLRRSVVIEAADHAAALAGLLPEMGAFDAAAHRVVHGGDRMAPVRVTPAVLDELDVLSPLAPLHNPPALAALGALAARAPDLPQVACFDTAFHARIPESARLYALPKEDRTAGLRRYGFHGLSYDGLVRELRARKELPRRLVALHLGGGASACAILDGVSVATTMGHSPVSGLCMGTRPGDVDPLAVLDMARRHGLDGATRRLTRASGLAALAGTADWSGIAGRDDPAAALARDHFEGRILEAVGAMAARLGGVDALAFTGGIGENDADLRGRIADALAWTGRSDVHVVPADEEATLARLAQEALG